MWLSSSHSHVYQDPHETSPILSYNLGIEQTERLESGSSNMTYKKGKKKGSR